MELGKSEINEGAAGEGLDFDPDDRIEIADANEPAGAREGGEPEVAGSFETALHDAEYLAAPVEGLAETREGFQELENGNKLYDHPAEAGERLNSDQGNAVWRVEGDCGLVSAENVARLAGKDVSEADVVGIARANGDCDYGVFKRACENGGTMSSQICDVLGRLGIAAEVKGKMPLDDMAKSVESGRGVIAAVEVSKFWGGAEKGGHAVAVTSVERTPDGKVAAFYVCDSGTGGNDSCRRVGVGQFGASLRDSIVTTKPIR